MSKWLMGPICHFSERPLGKSKLYKLTDKRNVDMSRQTTCITSPISRGVTLSNNGEPLGLINWMINNRLITNAPNTAQDCRIAHSIVRPYWLNLQIGSWCTQCCDFIRSL